MIAIKIGFVGMTVQDVEEIYNKNYKILLKTKNETEWNRNRHHQITVKWEQRQPVSFAQVTASTSSHPRLL